VQAVEQDIRAFITKNFFSSDPFADEDSLFDKGIVDSTGVLEVVQFIEEKFKLKVEDAEMQPENFESITKLSAYVRRKAGA
jgi:acyl carrier protein